MSAPDFEARYAEHADPFAVRTSRYERRKIDVVVAALTQPRYRLVWDLACGTGDLALAVAPRADHVHATDAAPTAVALSAELLGGRASTAVNLLPAHPGLTDVDLALISEVAYYLTDTDRQATYALVEQVCAPDAEVVSVTWRHRPGDAQLSGVEQTDETIAWFTRRGWTLAVRHDDTDFVSAHLVRGRYRTPAPGQTPGGTP